MQEVSIPAAKSAELPVNIAIKRAYEAAEKSDGCRILVDRVWPRGLSKEDLHIDLWLKEIAPSTALRKGFNHEPEKWAAFRERYLEELRANVQAAQRFNEVVRGHATVTLVYGAKDQGQNQAVVLRDFLRQQG